MHRRSRETLGKFLQNTPTPLNNQLSLFFGDCQLTSLTTGHLEDPLGEQPEIFEKPIAEESKEIIPHTYTMGKNRNDGENRNEGAFPSERLMEILG